MAIAETIRELKKQWQTAINTDRHIPNPADRKALFQRAINSLTSDQRKGYEEYAQNYYRSFGKDFYEAAFEPEYFDYHPEDRPPNSEEQESPYQMGKFHQVINNSLYNLESYAQGFIGCLIGSTFIGAGTMLGVFIREALLINDLYNEDVLSADQQNEMKTYAVLKMAQVFGIQHNETENREFENICTMIGIQPQFCFDCRNNWADPRISNFNSINLDQKTTRFLSDYASQNSWTKSLDNAIENHETTHVGDDCHRTEFVLSVALSMILVCRREMYMAEQGQYHLKNDLQILLERIVPDTSFQESLLQDLLGNAEKNMSVNVNNDFQILCENQFGQVSPICNVQNKEMIFSTFQKNFEALQADQKKMGSLYYSMGNVLYNAVYEGGKSMVLANYNYLMDDPNKQTRSPGEHAQLMKRPNVSRPR
jgi:hypothetical protein